MGMAIEEVIKWLSIMKANLNSFPEISNEKKIEALAEAIRLLKNEQSKEPRWIPVSERLPEKNVEVLATTEWGAVTIAEMYSANDWFIHEGTTNAEIDEIVAWMPLPEPYSEVEE